MFKTRAFYKQGNKPTMRDFIRLFTIFIKLFFISLIIFSCGASKSMMISEKVSISDKDPLTINKKLLSRDTYDAYTQFYIDEIEVKLAKSLADNSLVPLEHMNLFVWKIRDGDNVHKRNKLSSVLENNLKSMLQINHKVNVFDLGRISSTNYKKLMKKMNIEYILSGVFYEFRDGLSLNINIMTVKDSKIVASASTNIEQSFYQRVINMDYVGEDTDDDYFMKLKARK